MKYTKESKEEILSRFQASGLSMRAACRKLEGFPHPTTLANFITEQEAGLLHPPVLDVPGRCEEREHWAPYPLETKREALRLLIEGLEPRYIANRLNISSSGVINAWAAKIGRRDELDARSHPTPIRERAVTMYEDGTRVKDITHHLGIDARTIYHWLDRAGVERHRSMRKVTSKMEDESGYEEVPDEEVGEWTRAWGALPDDPLERARLAEVRLAEALAVLDTLKAPGPSSLSNSEKHRAGRRAKTISPLVRIADVVRDFRIARSTYFSQADIERREDKYRALRSRIKQSFKKSHERYGAQSIWKDLRRGEGVAISGAELAEGDMTTPVIVSEKVIRIIMAEEGLVPVQIRNARRHYDSYIGETDERPANHPLREDGTHDFHADKPGRLVVTDVTEFSLDAGKVYLSPIIDCYDGCPIAWRISLHPTDDLTAGSLEDALPMLERGCLIHTDGGGNYRSKRWKTLCEENGLIRSMSRKAKSPDNARAEGFFGTLKQEFFYAKKWKNIKLRRFMKLLDAYLVWYRDEKIKKALGWKTITEHRAALSAA